MTDVNPPARRKKVAKNALNDSSSELSKAMGMISKAHGPAVLTRADMKPRWKHISTGIFSLDIAMFGGLPEGLATLGFGWEHSGKTTMGLRMLGQAQKKYPKKTPVLIDTEGTYDLDWGAVHGIDNENLALVQPENGEQALDIAVAMIKTAEVSCLMIDSLSGIMPMKTKQKSFEDAVVAEQARLINRFCATIQSEMIAERHRGHNVAVYLVNQWRYKVGQVYGDPRVLPGGTAQHYLASIKIDFKNKEKDGRDDDGHHQIDYNEHPFNIKKNKVGNGPREGNFKMIRNPDHPLGQGFVDDAETVVKWGKSTGVVSGGGSTWRVDGVDQKFGRLQEIADYMYSNFDFFDHFKTRLIGDYRESRGLDRNYL